MGPELADQACGMPGGPIGESTLLKKDDVGFSGFHQVVGDAGPDRTLHR